MTRLEILRALRDPRYLALAVATPVGFYLLFAGLFGDAPTPPGGLPGRVEIMVAMAAYGAIWAVLSTTGPRIAQEREAGWLLQLRGMPLAGWRVLVAKTAAGVVTALPALVAVCVTAALVKGVRLELGQWVTVGAAMWAGTVPFAALGVLVGYAVGADASYVICYGLYMLTSAAGGLWIPPAQLPGAIGDVAVWLPSNRLADLGWQLAGPAPALGPAVLILTGWTLALGAAALLAHRHARL